MELRRIRFARLLNLLLPGVGLVLIGALWRGVLIGLTIAALANATLAFALLIPDEIPTAGFVALLVATGTAYAAAQVWVVRVAGVVQRSETQTFRAEVLARVAEHLGAGDGRAALAALAPLCSSADSDLLIAVRYAQALQAAGDQPVSPNAPAADEHADILATASGSRAALVEAWVRVRRLDPHRIYGREVRAALGEHRG
ncbi:MAG: hypothetical protein HRU75_05430 [Planctomycetia bacterium]|nr:MAG: hypothetical protein HRU75_05430 [Planctomycetia bacterium]